ncbi:MAG: AAA family ATPase [Candidatus Doudnabacteria bacterium]|nr:AAA family ATPase [Candidatus Doudnabacteria bacterium]
MTWETFGHDNVKAILEKQLKHKVFPHAYLFHGPSGVGKKKLALEFAKKVLETENLSSHPDFLSLDSSGQITMEATREFISRLGLKPFAGKYKVAILNDAENLSSQSANALLKTLEEPAENTIIILISSSSRLLSTILSRCQAFSFNAFSKARLSEFAKREKLEISEEILELSYGSISILNKIVADKDFFSLRKEAVEEYKSLIKAKSGERLARLSEIAENENEELEEKFKDWLSWQLAALHKNPGDYLKVQALSEALSGLKKNLNKKLVLQSLLLKI